MRYSDSRCFSASTCSARQLPASDFRIVTGLDTWIAQPGEYGWIALAGDDGFQYRQARKACDVADDMLNLHVHLRQGLVHVLHMLAGHLDQIVPMSHQRPYRAHLA